MYVSPNFPTKKALKEAIKAGQHVTIFQPAGIGETPVNGTATIEGPHYPKPHTWYAQVKVEGGKVTKVLR